MIQRAERMYGVKPELVNIVLGAGVFADFVVTQGLRTKAEQQQMVAKGASQTMNSKHLTGDAVDLAVLKDGKITWDFEEYERLAAVMKGVASKHGVRIVWGGDWHTLKDGPHFELVTHEGTDV
jgi:peptidoglycan L-alanyl-D-glutamate endopeptidase CwlK